MSYKSIQMELSRERRIANAIHALLDGFGSYEFTSQEGKALLKEHPGDCVQFDTLNDNGWLKVSRVEYFDLPDYLTPRKTLITLSNGWQATVSGDVSEFTIGGESGFIGITIAKAEAFTDNMQGKRYYYKVREDFMKKANSEFVNKDDITNAMGELREKLNELEADYESLKALKAMFPDNKD